MNKNENKYTFVFIRKGDQKLTSKLSYQDKFHIRIMAVCQMIAEHNKNAISLIMKSECREQFIIDEDNQEVRYEIILIERKKDRYAKC